jgi:hypothetical protein
VTWTSDDKDYSVNLGSTAGARSAQSDSPWALYSLVGKANFLDGTLHYVLQNDMGFADDVITGDGIRNYVSGIAADTNQNAMWYGINQYLMYDVLENLGVGVRAEWFRDNNGFRVWGPARCPISVNVDQQGIGSSYACNLNNMASYPLAGANYYGLTAGLNYKPLKWVILRPNFRYDWSSQNTYMSSNPGVQLDNQFTFSADVVISF